MKEYIISFITVEGEIYLSHEAIDFYHHYPGEKVNNLTKDFHFNFAQVSLL